MSLVKDIRSSDTLVIAATGFSEKLNLSVEDFFGETGLAEASRIIITDPSKNAMLGGFPPDYPTFLDFLDYLRHEVAALAPRRLLVTGTSLGGHAALLLGHLLKANYVVVFSPYTYLSVEEAERMEDAPLQAVQRRLQYKEGFEALSPELQPFLDLKNILSDWNGVTKYYVHISRYHKWDYKRAMYIHRMPRVSVVSHPLAMHSLIPYLAKQGKLRKCFAFPYRQEITPQDIYLHLENLKKRFTARVLRLVS